MARATKGMLLSLNSRFSTFTTDGTLGWGCPCAPNFGVSGVDVHGLGVEKLGNFKNIKNEMLNGTCISTMEAFHDGQINLIELGDHHMDASRGRDYPSKRQCKKPKKYKHKTPQIA